MAPLIEQMAELGKREDGCGNRGYRGYDGRCRYHSSWYWWGRWVFAGLAVLFIIIVFAFLFRNSRRRRRHGQQPLYGTGWMAPAPPPYYPPPPQYSAQDQNAGQQPGGYKYGSGDGYYGGHQDGSYSGHQDNYNGNQEGIQLQPPQSTYHRGTETEYAPPPGPPPNAAK